MMKRAVPIALGVPRRIATLALTVGMTVPVITAVLPTTASAAPDTPGLTSLARRYLEERAGRLLTGPAGARANPLPMGEALSRRVSSLDRHLETERGMLASTGLTYQRATVSTTPISVEAAGTQTRLRIHELTELFPPAGSPEPSTAYSVDRVFTFERQGAAWKIVDQRLADSEGIPPITETPDAPREPRGPADSLAPASDPADDEYNYGTVNLSLADAQDDADGDSTELIFPEPSSEEGSVPIGADKPADGGGGGASTLSIPAGLCYSCMKSYAYKYWDNYNTAYRNFAANGGGGDCTNFISQIMRNGGWTFDYGWYRSGENWWYNSSNQTWTWAGAENWSYFAPKRTIRLGNVWYMGVTDVLQMDFDRNGGMDHTMIATYRSSSNIYMTYHSSDTLNRPLSTILSANPGTWFYAYRT